jgi:two-component system, OmpR family, sensor histidine kinase MprB
MSFRRRTVLLASAAVALAIVLASVVVYFVTAGELRAQVDTTLRQRLAPGTAQSVQVRQVKLSAKDRRSLEQSFQVIARAPKQTVFAGARHGFSERRGSNGGGPILEGGSSAAAGAAGYIGRAGVGGDASAPPAPNMLLSPKALIGPRRFLHAKAIPGVKFDGAFGLNGIIHRGRNGSVTALSISLPSGGFAGTSGYAQILLPDGEVITSGGSGAKLPITARTRAVAGGRLHAYFSDATVSGTRLRVLTEKAPAGGVWQVALPLTDVNNTLDRLLLVLGAVSLGGVLLAAALGLLVSRAALAPVRRLTGATERIARTQDLAHRIPTGARDELGRLAASFNTMLAALERSRLAQRQLVSDASHELRTPLTSVQANLDALALGDVLAPADRERAVSCAQAQLRELTVLVGDLVDLSKTEVEAVEVEDVRLDLAVAAALRRVSLHAPRVRFALVADPCLVRAAPARLDRAIVNLLDNAVKWSPPAGVVEVLVGDGRLEVRDHGSGIAVEDLPRVFDRFYRARSARGRPGSGLGLAIVRQFAETHGGTVRAENDPGGGARLILELGSLPIGSSELREQAALQQAPLLPSGSSHINSA